MLVIRRASVGEYLDRGVVNIMRRFEAFSVVGVFEISLIACLSISFDTTIGDWH